MEVCSVLIIDDDKDDVEILSDAFNTKGVKNVHHVSSAFQAIEYLNSITKKEALPKLIVVDLYLPAKNGLELMSDLKNTEPFNQIPVVLFSSLNFELVQNINQTISATDYVKKPTNYNEYLKVAEYLNHRIVA